MNKRITGISWPLRFHGGRLAVSHDEIKLQENIMIIVGTGKMELPMKPDFGCDLGRRVFDPINVMALAQGDVAEAVRRYEPRVELLSVKAEI